jgi:hypothetical protein
VLLFTLPEARGFVFEAGHVRSQAGFLVKGTLRYLVSFHLVNHGLGLF